MPKESFIELKQSEVLESLKNELKKLVKSEEPDRNRQTHMIYIPHGENPNEVVEAFEAENQVGPHDVIFTINISGSRLPGAEKKEIPPDWKKAFADEEDPVIEDLQSAEKKPLPKFEEVKNPLERKKGSTPRPPRFYGLTWSEIRTLIQDDPESVTPEEKAWLRGRHLPGSWMPIL